MTRIRWVLTAIFLRLAEACCPLGGHSLMVISKSMFTDIPTKLH